jgi:methionine aminotransferase
MPVYGGKIVSKLPKAGTTIFSVMSALANECGAINLSQGFPNFPPNEELIDRVCQAMKSGYNQYAPMQGIMPLREIIAEKMQDEYGVQYDPEKEITITSGGTQAIYTAIAALVREGDEVIVFEPAYDCYTPAIELAGGIPVYGSLEPPSFNIHWEQVRKLINHRTRIIMINTPHNPSGTVWSKSDMMELERLTRNTDIIIISDEVYEHLIFDGQQHQSVCRFPLLAQRSIVIFSFGKTYHATGWKMGYCLAPSVLMSEFRKCHQFIVFSANTPIQYALAEIMKQKQLYHNLPSFFQQKRDYFLSLLKNSAFTFTPAAGSYFQLLGYKKLSQEKDTDYAVRLTREAGVASIPVSVFYHHAPSVHMLRFCFAKTNDTLEQAAEKLLKYHRKVMHE